MWKHWKRLVVIWNLCHALDTLRNLGLRIPRCFKRELNEALNWSQRIYRPFMALKPRPPSRKWGNYKTQVCLSMWSGTKWLPECLQLINVDTKPSLPSSSSNDRLTAWDLDLWNLDVYSMVRWGVNGAGVSLRRANSGGTRNGSQGARGQVMPSVLRLFLSPSSHWKWTE